MPYGSIKRCQFRSLNFFGDLLDQLLPCFLMCLQNIFWEKQQKHLYIFCCKKVPESYLCVCVGQECLHKNVIALWALPDATQLISQEQGGSTHSLKNARTPRTWLCYFFKLAVLISCPGVPNVGPRYLRPLGPPHLGEKQALKRRLLQKPYKPLHFI